MPIVTIGLPFYNHAQFLNEAIKSIVNQTFTDWELLLINDGSTDQGQAIADTWTRDPRIRIIADGKRLGRSSRLNQVATLAKGYYLARMDADDLMTPNRLQEQIDYLVANSDVDIVASFAYIMNAHGQVYAYRGTTHLPTQLQQALAGFPLIHPAIMGRTMWFRQHAYGPQWQRIEDLALWLSVFSTTRIRVIPKPLLFYREQTSYANYQLAMTEYRRLLTVFRHQVPMLTSLKHYLLTYGKEAIFCIAQSTGWVEWLRRRRSKPLSEYELEKAHQLLTTQIRTGLS